MDTKNSFSRRSFIVMMLFMSLLLLAADLIYDSGVGYLSEKILETAGGLDGAGFERVLAELRIPFTLMAGVLFYGVGLLLWGILRLFPADTLVKPALAQGKRPAPAPEKVLESKEERLESDRRIYFHLLSVFQREGRLVDFFAEDLTLYEDAQIGAAVRSIQENCKKTMEKYLKPTSVMEQNEGDEVTIDGTYNPDEIKLIGNVSGNPPFKGVLRHKGWRAGKAELPKLAAGKDSRLIAPAEVEIL